MQNLCILHRLDTVENCRFPPTTKLTQLNKGIFSWTSLVVGENIDLHNEHSAGSDKHTWSWPKILSLEKPILVWNALCFGIDNHGLRRVSGWGSWISVISFRRTENFADLKSQQLNRASIRLAFTVSKLNTPTTWKWRPLRLNHFFFHQFFQALSTSRWWNLKAQRQSCAFKFQRRDVDRICG